MSLTITEVVERLAKTCDEVTLLEILEITSYDLVERFYDRIEERYDELVEELEEQLQDDETEV